MLARATRGTACRFARASNVAVRSYLGDSRFANERSIRLADSFEDANASVKIDLHQSWTEFLSALIAHRVRFVLVGGHAMASHAEPRFTDDLDVFVEPSLANGERLRAALVTIGFDAASVVGRKPNRIDILTGIDGVTFAEAWEGRVEAEFAASPLYVIGRGELLANKRAAGRAKDLLDVAALERVSVPATSTHVSAGESPRGREETATPSPSPGPGARGLRIA